MTGAQAPGGALLLLALALVAGWAGLAQLVRAAADRRRLLTVLGAAGRPAPRVRVPADPLLRLAAGRRLAARLEEADVRCGPSVALLALAVAALAGRVAGGFVLAGPATVAGGPAGVVAVLVLVQVRRARRREAFTRQVPDVAQALAGLTFAGLSLHNALAAVPREVGEPAAGEFRRLVRARELGHPLESSLAELCRRQPSRELTVLVTTLTLTARSGGDLVRVLRGTADTLRRRRDVRGEVATMLASARANSYGMVVLVVGFVGFLRSLDPDAFALLFASPLGLVVIAVATTLIVAGTLLIRRITRIEV